MIVSRPTVFSCGAFRIVRRSLESPNPDTPLQHEV